MVTMTRREAATAIQSEASAKAAYNTKPTVYLRESQIGYPFLREKKEAMVRDDERA
jgi:hypothetical protein